MKKISNFFKDVKKEISKVIWPNNNNMVKYTTITIVFIVFFAVFFLSIDFVVAFFKSLGV